MYYLMNKDIVIAEFEKSNDILDNEFHMVQSDETKLHKKTASKCKLFTSEQEGFVPFSSLYRQRVSPRKMLEFYAEIGCEEDFIAISKSLLTSEIRADLINMYGFQFECREDKKFTAERVKSIEKIVNRQIAGILDKEKMYTVDVFKKSRNGR